MRKPPGVLIRLPTHALGVPAVSLSVRGVEIEVGAGELVAVLGPAAERACLTAVLVGEVSPEPGTVRLFGRDPRTALRDGTLARSPRPDADVVVLDDPARKLGPAARPALWQRLRDLAARGCAVLCTTGLPAEAAEFAQRILVLYKGMLVADGIPAAITEAAARGRGLRATVPGAELSALRALPGVATAIRRGDRVELACTDSDAAVHALVAKFPCAHDIEVVSGSLAEAFRAVQGEDPLRR